MANPKDVLVIAQYSGNGPQSNNRFREICRNLVEAGAQVELVTSTFSHSGKKQVDLVTDNFEEFKIVQIEEPGYLKNVSFKRIRSHKILGRNLEKYLEERKAPDVIYCAVPSLSLAEVASKYAKKNNITLIIDIQDLWPEAFEIVLRQKVLATILFAPLRRQADKIYALADTVITVSDTYSSRAMQVRNRDSDAITVYLGTNLKTFDEFPAKPWSESSGVIQIVYIGTLGHNYDLPLVFESLRILKGKGLEFRMHIMGSGPLEASWIEMSKDLADEVTFHGRLDYAEMVSRLRACDIALNPIVPGAAGSIINKVCDYAAAGLPVVNSQENREYRRLLSEYDAGINCESTPISMANAIESITENSDLRSIMGNHSRRLAEEKFDRSQTYKVITEKILHG